MGCFSAAAQVVRKGKKKPITTSDLWELPKEYQSNENWNHFEMNWKKELKTGKPSLYRALRSTYWKDFALAMGYQVL